MDTNTCVRLHGPKDLRVDHRPIPEPGPNEVKVKPAYVGVCGTDVHFYDHGYLDRYVLDGPCILGHEISAVVSQLGSDVTKLTVGDRVAIDPNQPCFECKFCREGRKSVCEKAIVSGIPSTDGGLARYMIVKARNCYKLPDNISLEEGVCAETLSIGVWALHRGRVSQGDVVVVMGMGPVGLLTFQAAKAMGAATTLVLDPNPDRLRLATELGADLTYQVLDGDMEDPDTLATKLKSILRTEADLCIECSGAPGTVDTALLMCRKAGRVVMVGFGKVKFEANFGAAAIREVDLLGSVCNNLNFPETVDLMGSGKVKAGPLLSSKLPMSNFLDALELVRKGQEVKVIIDCQA